MGGKQRFFYAGRDAITEEVKLTSVAVKTTPNKTTYFTGDKLATAGLTLTATYSDGSTQTITSGFTCDPSVLTVAGKQAITVTFDGQTTSFAVDVEGIYPTGASIQTNPDKMEYTVGEWFDLAGLSMKITYNNGSSQIANSGFSCNPAQLDKPGMQMVEVAVNWDGYNFTDYVYVTVKEAAENLPYGAFGENITWELNDGVLTFTGTGEMPILDVIGETAQTPWLQYADTIHTVSIGHGITNVAGYLFSGYTNLAQVYLADTVTDIVNFAFYNCTGLKEITIPEYVTHIRAAAFAGCIGLSKINIPESVTFIGIQAFWGCTGLSEITIPAGVKTIDGDAFGGCYGLNRITVLSKDCVIANNYESTLGDLKMTVIRCYRGSTAETFAKTYGFMFEYLDAQEDVVASGKYGDNITWELKDGVLTLTGKGDMPDAKYETFVDELETQVPWYAYRDNIYTVNITYGITSIGGYAFCNCEKLTQISIPSSVNSIKEWAFTYCGSLVHIDLPDSIKSISEWAFAHCENLLEICIPIGVASIGDYAFYARYGYNKLDQVTILNKECVIYDGRYSLGVPETTTIRGYKGSTAEAYAQTYGYKFEALD